jgi:hypothetical protein
VQFEIGVGFEPSTGTRQVDQHFWLLGTELTTSSLESGDQAAGPNDHQGATVTPPQSSGAQSRTVWLSSHR